jgi:hypothetical protein
MWSQDAKHNQAGLGLERIFEGSCLFKMHSVSKAGSAYIFM